MLQADISEFAHFSVNDGGRLAAKGQEMVFDFIENFSKPVIAAVNGFALGGGWNWQWRVTLEWHQTTQRWDCQKYPSV